MFEAGQLLVSEIESVIRPAMAATRRLAVHPDVIRILEESSRSPAQDFCNNHIRGNKDIDTVAIFDKTGSILAINTVFSDGTPVASPRVQRVLGSDFHNRKIITACLQNKSNREVLEFQTNCDITPAYFDSSGLSVAHSVPVYSAASNKPLGIVSTRLEFTRISRLLPKHPFASGEGRAYLVSDQGIDFVEEHDSGINKSPLSQELLKTVLKPCQLPL